MAPPQTLFNVMLDGKRYGGSYDNISAVTIMCAVAQMFIGVTGGGTPLTMVTVEDSTGKVIAAIGNLEQPPTETAPTEDPPVLEALQPDSSGQWDAQVRAIGSNFKQNSVLVANDTEANTAFISSTELSSVVPGVHTPGTYQVKVRTGTLESAELPFTAL